MHGPSRPRRARALAVLVASIALGAAGVHTPAAGADGDASWRSAGNGLLNWRNQPDEERIGARNASGLAPAWVATMAGDVSATPSVDEGAVYVPDWGGKVSKLDARTGAVVWRVDLPTVTGVTGALSRNTPTIAGNTVLVGTQNGARLVALNKTTGSVKWITTVDTQAFAILTQSPTVFNGVVYQGVASSEEAATAFIPNYPCCFFRGNVNAIDLATGALLWKSYMTPAISEGASRYSGAAVWGSSPVVDVNRGALYVTTGNNYSVPDSVAACTLTSATPSNCDDARNLVDAVVALDLVTGAVRWSDSLGLPDAWNVACIFTFVNPASCPAPAGPDYDFGQGAMLVKAKVGGKQTDVLVAGQKSGVMWGINPVTGAVLWGTQAGPGGTLGGLEWGSATDGKRIYFAISNNGRKAYAGAPSLGDGGSWGALDPATGAILWRTKDPNGSIDPAAVSVANGVVYAGSLEADPSKPTFFALDAATGQIRWSFVSGGSVNSGAAIANGTVYWGSGYANFGLGSPNDKLYAFRVPG